MQKHQSLIALYDANSELAIYGDAGLADVSRALGSSLAGAGIGAIARVGSPAILTALSSVHESGASAIALSPAASLYEHEHAFRLSKMAMPLIFTGRGGLGADVVALSSSIAVVIIGSDEEALLGVLGCVGEGSSPIAILTPESAPVVREKVSARYAKMLPRLIISSDPEQIVRELSEHARRKHLNERLSN